jgi:succinate dehydrogenase/fumarate reductase cytochrome b subunit
MKKFIIAFIFNLIVASVVYHIIIVGFFVSIWDFSRITEMYTSEGAIGIFRIAIFIVFLASFMGRLKIDFKSNDDE